MTLFELIQKYCYYKIMGYCDLIRDNKECTKKNCPALAEWREKGGK